MQVRSWARVLLPLRDAIEVLSLLLRMDNLRLELADSFIISFSFNFLMIAFGLRAMPPDTLGFEGDDPLPLRFDNASILLYFSSSFSLLSSLPIPSALRKSLYSLSCVLVKFKESPISPIWLHKFNRSMLPIFPAPIVRSGDVLSSDASLLVFCKSRVFAN